MPVPGGKQPIREGVITAADYPCIGLVRGDDRSWSAHTAFVDRGTRYSRGVNAAAGGWESWSWDESLFAGAAGFFDCAV